MKQILSLTTVAIALAFGGWHLYGQAPTGKRVSGEPVTNGSPIALGPEQLKPFMQRKLDHSKSVLEGLVMEDFEMIAKNAQALT